ncbi:MAG: hypothetical protein HY282_09440 [Nitrospirae bacterium]|nr:hypothetical protein [Candidatus Manganitrophaceae bacterium]
MIRIKRVRITYDRLPLDRKAAARLSKQILSQLQKELEQQPEGASGTLDRLSPRPIRIASDRTGRTEIARRAAGAVCQELVDQLDRKKE